MKKKLLYELRFAAVLTLMFAFCIQPLSSNAQGQKMSLKETQVSLKKVIEKVEKLSGLSFLYNGQLVDVNKFVSIDIANADLKTLLDEVFKNTGISYKIVDKQIVLSPKGQNGDDATSKGKGSGISDDNGRTVKGKVLDQNGESIPGATVLVPGTKTGAITDANGNFSVSIPLSAKSLQISFIGYQSREVALTSGSAYDVILEQSHSNLDEVVVTGFQKLSKERATGSFSTIKVEQLEKPASDISQRLIGTSAGVQTTVDASGNVSFQIRGLTSLNSDAQPLVVVDGFPIEGGFSTINPNDVESISILKDAAAASIWGARSANGVIVVTLKSGAKQIGKTIVRANSFVKIGKMFDYRYTFPYASSSDAVSYIQNAFNLAGRNNVINGTDASSLIPGSLNDAYIALNENRLGYLSDADLKSTLSKLRSFDNTKQVKDLFLQNPITQQYNVSIQNATDRSSTAVSAMYETNKQYLKGNGNEKIMANVKSTTSLYKWLDFDLQGTFTRNVTEANSSIDLLNLYPFQRILNEDGSRSSVVKDIYMPNMQRNVLNTFNYKTDGFPYEDWSYNPLTEREARNNKLTSLNYRAQLGLTFKPFKGFTYEMKGQAERSEAQTKNIVNDKSYEVRYFVNTYSTWDQDYNYVTANIPKGSKLSTGSGESTTYNFRNQANYEHTFGDKHYISAIAGTEILSRVYQTKSNADVWGYDEETMTVATLPNGFGGSYSAPVIGWLGEYLSIPYTSSFSYLTDRYFSAYANASYTYDSKVTLSGSVRTDASNLVTDDPKMRYSPFWSVGANWILSKEKFMKNFSFVDHLNIRATYGYNGNVNRSTSPMPLIGLSSYPYYYTGQLFANVTSYGNPNLTWEKTGNLNVGIDYSLLKGKLFGKIDVYNKKGDNLLVDVNISSVNGTTLQMLNAGKMVNRGIEIEVGSTLPIADRISWTGNLSFSYNHNEITKLNKSTYTHGNLWGGRASSMFMEGYDAYSLWSLRYAGMMNVGTEANPEMYPAIYDSKGVKHPFTSNFLSGDIRDYMVNSGTTVAPYIIGFTTQLNVYDFQISAIVTGKMGHKFRGYQYNYPTQNIYGAGSSIPNDLWKEVSSSDGSSVVPVPTKLDSQYPWIYYYPLLDYRVQDATHFRLQEVNITYRVPRLVLSKLGIADASIFVQGNNLALLAFNKYNEDPEYPKGTIKPVATYLLGIKLSF